MSRKVLRSRWFRTTLQSQDTAQLFFKRMVGAMRYVGPRLRLIGLNTIRRSCWIERETGPNLKGRWSDSPDPFRTLSMRILGDTLVTTARGGFQSESPGTEASLMTDQPMTASGLGTSHFRN